MEKTLPENQQTIPSFKDSDMGEKDRYYLPCANDDNVPKCYMCRELFSNMKSLFDHMGGHDDSDWRGMLPPEPRKSAVIVRRTLLLSSSSTSGLSETESPKFDDEAGCVRCAEAVDLKKFLPVVEKTGKRGRPAAAGCRKDDGTAAEGGGKVIFKFDLNEVAVMMD